MELFKLENKNAGYHIAGVLCLSSITNKINKIQSYKEATVSN